MIIYNGCIKSNMRKRAYVMKQNTTYKCVIGNFIFYVYLIIINVSYYFLLFLF